MDKEQALEKFGKSYDAGAILFNEGDSADKLWVINEGHVRISKFVCGEEVELAILGPGEYCGELALLQQCPQPVSAIVVSRARLIELPAAQFESLIRSNGELAMRMLKKMAGRLNEAQFRISVLQMRTNMGRTMVQLRAESLNSGDAPCVIPENLASYLGIDDVELELIIDKLVTKKLIELNDDNTFIIPDVEEYERYSRYLELQDRYAFFDK